MLRTWVERARFGPDDLIFRTRTGAADRVELARAWQRALRSRPPVPARLRLPARRRHHLAAAGVPLGEVARRLGHSVETLVSTYVGALTGDERNRERANRSRSC